jgi:hypothetical protein
MAADVADVCDLPRGAGPLLSFFFAVTKFYSIFGTKAGSSRVREFSRAKELRHKNFQKFLGALFLSADYADFRRLGANWAGGNIQTMPETSKLLIGVIILVSGTPAFTCILSPPREELTIGRLARCG